MRCHFSSYYSMRRSQIESINSVFFFRIRARVRIALRLRAFFYRANIWESSFIWDNFICPSSDDFQSNSILSHHTYATWHAFMEYPMLCTAVRVQLQYSLCLQLVQVLRNGWCDCITNDSVSALNNALNSIASEEQRTVPLFRKSKMGKITSKVCSGHNRLVINVCMWRTYAFFIHSFIHSFVSWTNLSRRWEHEPTQATAHRCTNAFNCSKYQIASSFFSSSLFPLCGLLSRVMFNEAENCAHLSQCWWLIAWRK